MIFSSYIFIFAFLPVMLVGFYGLRYFNLHRGANVFFGAWQFIFLCFLECALFAYIDGFYSCKLCDCKSDFKK